MASRLPPRLQRPSDLPVIVVGAGPVGMTAAARLAREGLPVIVVESEPIPKTDWRASTFHAATLELLEDIGVTEQMRAEGLVVPIYHFRDRRDGLIATFDFGLLADETRYPYRLQLNQQHLVRMLHERLRAADGVELLFGCQVTDVATTADGVSATVRTPRGERVLRGSHLIGADGAASTVRQVLGIDFPGPTYPERMQGQLQAMAPVPGGYPIIDHQIYNVHQRVAATFRVGDIVIAGDAAHINSPIGGVGLNSGIHDVMDVVPRIARIRAGAADPEAELTAYDLVRRRIAVDYVQADTHRNTERLKETDAARRRASQE